LVTLIFALSLEENEEHMLVLKRHRGQVIEFACQNATMRLAIRDFDHRRGRCDLALERTEAWPVNPARLRLKAGIDRTLKAPCGEIRIGFSSCTAKQVILCIAAPRECSIYRFELPERSGKPPPMPQPQGFAN
jgi:hypothetical protein